ncbi:MAG: LuxR C-terminal-related transcriptional regulator [Mycobacterium sp.]
MRLSWPLIGRTRQMRDIGASIAAPDTAGVVVSGPAGVGKSRLARDALAAAESLGFESRWVVGASSARSIPMGVFTAWTQPGATDSVHLVRGVIESLTATTSGGPILLGVDDAHLLDDLSAFVVHQLVQRGTAKVVLTVRDDEPTAGAVRDIAKLAHFDRVDLQPLSVEEASALLSAVLEGPLDRDAAQGLWRLTGGNPLYLINIVEQEVADGRLAVHGGLWRWTGDPSLPPDLVGLVEDRMGALPAAIADVVDVLAVAEPLDLTMLTRITDPKAVEEAEIRNLISLDRSGDRVRAHVSHPLYGEVRRRKAPQTRLRRLRGLVAAHLANAADSRDIRNVVQRATLSIESDLTPDVNLLVDAAHGAVWLGDLSLADRLARAAIDAGAGPEPSLVRAHALSWLGRGVEAEAVLSDVAVGELSDELRGRLAFLRASNMLWALGDPARAKDIIDDASDVTSPQGRSYIGAFLTVYWFAIDEPHEAVLASEKLVVADLPPVVGAEIAWALATIAADAGRTGDAVSIAEAGYAAATRSFDAPHMRFNIADAHVGALLLAGQTAEAVVVADRVKLQAADLPGAAQLLGIAIAGRATLGAGRLDLAEPLLDQSVSGLSSSHSLGWGYRYLIPRTTALAMRGATAQAHTALGTLESVRRRFRSLDYERSLAQAWVSAAQGAVSEAITIVCSAAERASAKGQFAAEVLCLQTAAQFGCRDCAARLAELVSIVEGPRARLAAEFASALQAGDADELTAVSEEFERIGDLVAAVDAAAHAALAYRRGDRRGSALTCSTRAAGLAERCGGAVTPALREAADPLPLTGREREIVMLIADGMSNREVAERLTLSVRTVESHIYRAMARTGTASREELAALLGLPRNGHR